MTPTTCDRSPTGQHVARAGDIVETAGGAHEYALTCACCNRVLRRFGEDYEVVNGVPKAVHENTL